MYAILQQIAKAVLWAALAASTLVFAHGSHQGDLQLDHPYAVPSAPEDAHGKAYLRGIQNTGMQADRLIGASTPLAQRVVLHRLTPDAHGFRGMEVSAIELPPKSTTLLRHTGDYQLSLINLKKPLKDGDRFDLTLTFERAGSQTVKVWVQTPRDVPGGEQNRCCFPIFPLPEALTCSDGTGVLVPMRAIGTGLQTL